MAAKVKSSQIRTFFIIKIDSVPHYLPRTKAKYFWEQFNIYMKLFFSLQFPYAGLVINGFKTLEDNFLLICSSVVKPIVKTERHEAIYHIQPHGEHPVHPFTSSIIYKYDKLDKAKHYIITFIEHLKIPKLKSLLIKHL